MRIFPLILFYFLAFPRLITAQNHRPDELFDLGEQAYNEGNNQEAIEWLNKCLIKSPKYSRAYFVRGAAKEQVNDLTGALTDYSIYVDLKPDNAEAIMSRAQVRYKLGYFEQAKEDFLKLLTLPPGETNTVFFKENMSEGDTQPIVSLQSGNNAFIFNSLGLCEYNLKNFKQAIKYFDSALALQKNEPDYFVNRGLAKVEIQDSTARLDYEKALKIKPSHTAAMSNLSALNSKKKNTAKAHDLLDQAINDDPDAIHPYLQRAGKRYNAGDYSGALEDYNRALVLDTTAVEIRIARGVVREKLLDYEGAYADYTKAIDLDERNDKAWLNRANVLGKLKEYEKAIEDYTVVILYNENNAAAYYNRAMAREKLKQLTEACDDLTKAEVLGLKVDDKTKEKICVTPK